jgi:hypothetical protein
MADPDEALLGRPVKKWGRWYRYVRNDAGRLTLERTDPPRDATPHCWCGAPVVARQKSIAGDVTYLTRCSADPTHVWHKEPGSTFRDAADIITTGPVYTP